MIAYISQKGILSIKAETETETYALTEWLSCFTGSLQIHEITEQQALEYIDIDLTADKRW